MLLPVVGESDIRFEGKTSEIELGRTLPV